MPACLQVLALLQQLTSTGLMCCTCSHPPVRRMPCLPQQLTRRTSDGGSVSSLLSNLALFGGLSASSGTASAGSGAVLVRPAPEQGSVTSASRPSACARADTPA